MKPTTESTPAVAAGRKPRDDEIDVFGLTHAGHVRKNNQDHFLLGSLRKEMQVLQTSLPSHQVGGGNERVAFLAMVADGVGGGPKGEEASRLALEAITDYVASSTQCYYSMDATDESFLSNLAEGARQVHADVLARASGDPELRGMATTLTLWIGVWPRVYLLQVGDSRCYLYRKNQLTQISRDQTMAQELLDQGVLTRGDAARTPWSNVLSSSIGGGQTAPVVTRAVNEWNNTWLLCSDGLTKHVSDEGIGARLAAMTTAKEVCELLLKDALDAGGTDNVTIIVGRSVAKGPTT
jgi:serine/threonine protein phosphatase PrpC